ncbi:MAG: hypothetical protein GY810_01060 [Aureispira sp.]|nr:hypothetical protein [Aureispira sp.]
MDKHQIVDDILNKNRIEDLSILAEMRVIDLITLHHSLGRWIRNSYGLWAEDNDNMKNDECLSELHADQYSQKTIQLLWNRLQ